MEYGEQLLKQMHYANNNGNTGRAVELAERLIAQLPDSDEAAQARKFIDSLGVSPEHSSSADSPQPAQEARKIKYEPQAVSSKYGTAKTVGSLLEFIGWLG